MHEGKWAGEKLEVSFNQLLRMVMVKHLREISESESHQSRWKSLSYGGNAFLGNII